MTDLPPSSLDFAMQNYEKYREMIAHCDLPDLEALAMLLIQKRSVDGLDGRRWDAMAHSFFEDAVKSMLEKITHENPIT
jgi:hypothetical protein